MNRRIRLAFVVGVVAVTAAAWTHTAAGDGDVGFPAPETTVAAPSTVTDAGDAKAPAASYRRPRVIGKPGRRVFGPRADSRVSAPDGSRIRCSLDREPFTPCGKRIRLRDLDEGDHRLRIRVRTPDGEVHRLGPLTWTTWLVARPTNARAHVARIRWSAPVINRPGGRRIGFISSATAVASKPTRLLVLAAPRRADDEVWLRVLLPYRSPQKGWIRARDTNLSTTGWRIRVNVRARSLTVLFGGRKIARTRVVVGAPDTPTPTRMAAIYEKVRQADPSAFLGPWALHLTSLSAVHRYFDGGPGRIALHGRGAESLFVPLGTAASNGCVRLDNRFVSWVANNVPSGTPVEIN